MKHCFQFVKDLVLLSKYKIDVCLQITERGGKGIAVYCDHSDADDIKRLFERIEREQNGQLDILVNNAYSAVNVSFCCSQANGLHTTA